MRLWIPDAKTNGHDIQKGGIRQLCGAAQIVTGMETQFVDPGAESVTLEQRSVDAAVGVGCSRNNRFNRRAETIQVNR